MYLPRRVVPAVWDLYERAGWQLIDTTASDDAASPHPFALQDLAYHAVQAEREAAEQALAERWCAEEREPIFVDGGISGSERVAASACAVGVVKSHRTLYAEGDLLAAVLALPAAHRTPAFVVTSARRAAVASWYLRLRGTAGRDPFWGLVRVECALHDDIASRADHVSRMVLQESAPLALPDGRWDRMVYGVRDCEEYLEAIC